MRRLLVLTDNLLNGITTYRLMLYCLRVIISVAIIFGFTGVLAFPGLAMVWSFVVLLGVCYLVNALIGLLLDIPTNYESPIITALILFCIFTPTASVSGLLMLAAVAAIAMISKYVLAIRHKHVFNPAGIAAVIASLVGLTAASWWIATPVMLPFTLLAGLLIVRKVRRFQMSLVFVLAALVVMVLVGLAHGNTIAGVLGNSFTSWPLVFFGTIMLTEPSTSPVRYKHQLVYGLGVGILFASQFHLGRVSTTPEVVLALGNMYAFIVNPKYRLNLRLKQKIQLSERVWEYVFTPNRPLTFRPGQYMEWTLPLSPLAVMGNDNRGNRRTFTIASSPTESEVHLGVKFYEPSSAYKQALQKMKVGDQLAAGQISGDFVLPTDKSQKLLFIAGGIGITPFRSILKYLVDQNERRDIVLFYSAASQSEVSFQEVLTAAAAVGVTVIPFFGKADAATIKQYVPDLTERRAFLSGPHAMVVGYEDMLHAAGVERRQMVVDYFPGY